LHLSDLLFVAYKITQCVQEGLTYLHICDKVIRVSDDVYRGYVEFQNFSLGQNNEIFIMQRNRVPMLIDLPDQHTTPINTWTDNADNFEVTLRREIPLDIVYWIISDDYDDLTEFGLLHYLHLKMVLSRERTGLRARSVQFIDARNSPNRNDYLTYSCSTSSNIFVDIGHYDNCINVYYVDDLGLGSGTKGMACREMNNSVVLSKEAYFDLLTHEIGHLMGLWHIDSDGPKNVMKRISSQREFFTEGQIFRCFTDPNSLVHDFDNRSRTTRDCATSLNPDYSIVECPPQLLRIWEDPPRFFGFFEDYTGEQERCMSLIGEYLLQDCTLGESSPNSLLEKFVGYGSEAQNILMSILENGPPDLLVRHIENSIRSFSSELKAFQEEGGYDDIEDKELLKSIATLDLNHLLEIQKRSLNFQIQKRALEALKEFNNDEVKDRLRIILEKDANHKLAKKIAGTLVEMTVLKE